MELNTGEVGIVISQNPGLRLKPNIALLLDPDKKGTGSYPIICLANDSYSDEKSRVTITKTLANGAYGLNIEECNIG